MILCKITQGQSLCEVLGVLTAFFFPGDSPDHQTIYNDLIKLCKSNKHNLKYWIYAIDTELAKLDIEERGSEVN